MAYFARHVLQIIKATSTEVIYLSLLCSRQQNGDHWRQWSIFTDWLSMIGPFGRNYSSSTKVWTQLIIRQNLTDIYNPRNTISRVNGSLCIWNTNLTIHQFNILSTKWINTELRLNFVVFHLITWNMKNSKHWRSHIGLTLEWNKLYLNSTVKKTSHWRVLQVKFCWIIRHFCHLGFWSNIKLQVPHIWICAGSKIPKYDRGRSKISFTEIVILMYSWISGKGYLAQQERWKSFVGLLYWN